MSPILTSWAILGGPCQNFLVLILTVSGIFLVEGSPLPSLGFSSKLPLCLGTSRIWATMVPGVKGACLPFCRSTHSAALLLWSFGKISVAYDGTYCILTSNLHHYLSSNKLLVQISLWVRLLRRGLEKLSSSSMVTPLYCGKNLECDHQSVYYSGFQTFQAPL